MPRLVLARVGKTDPKKAPHVRFEIRPAGKGAPKIDPKPILDGWKLLETTAIYHRLTPQARAALEAEDERIIERAGGEAQLNLDLGTDIDAVGHHVPVENDVAAAGQGERLAFCFR